MAPAQSETRLAVVEVRTRLAFEARTFDGLHVTAITPINKKKKKNRYSLTTCLMFRLC